MSDACLSVSCHLIGYSSTMSLRHGVVRLFDVRGPSTSSHSFVELLDMRGLWESATTAEELVVVEDADERLFRKVLHRHHVGVLDQLLPPIWVWHATQLQETTPWPRLTLPEKKKAHLSAKNFIVKLLYKETYWYAFPVFHSLTSFHFLSNSILFQLRSNNCRYNKDRSMIDRSIDWLIDWLLNDVCDYRFAAFYWFCCPLWKSSMWPWNVPNISWSVIYSRLASECAQWSVITFMSLPVPEIIGGTKKFGCHWIRPRSSFSQIFKRLLFGWTLWIYLPNSKFVVLSVSEIIGGTQIWAVPGYAHSPFSPEFLMGFWMYLNVNVSAALPCKSSRFYKVVRQHNSGAVEDFILPYSAVCLRIYKCISERIIEIGPHLEKLL